MARAMIHGNNISERFWEEAINTTCYVINRVYIRAGTDQTPYELWKGKKPNISYFRVFGCVCYILNDKDQLGKFDSCSEEGFFLGYSPNRTAYQVFNKARGRIEESMNVVFDDGITSVHEVVPAIDFQEINHPMTGEENEADVNGIVNNTNTVTNQVHRNHSPDDIIGDISGARQTRKKVIDFKSLAGIAQMDVVMYVCFVASFEPKNMKETLSDHFWIGAMQEELEEFSRNDVWMLVPRPIQTNVIGTKWVFKNKSDEDGNITRNKARLVA